jgi:hypothetical protein
MAKPLKELYFLERLNLGRLGRCDREVLYNVV